MNNSNDNFNDPFAVLGVSVCASESQIQTHYRNLAKSLHPDALLNNQKASVATELLSKIVNPAYEKLKKERSRKALLLDLKCVAKTTNFPPENYLTYERKLKELVSIRNQSIDEFHKITRTIEELNLAYLSSESRSASSYTSKLDTSSRPKVMEVSESSSTSKNNSAASLTKQTYDQKHYERAKTYASNGSWSDAINELKEAIKINPSRSQYHSLLGFSYFNLKMKGMARAYLKRALELNPSDALAIRYLPLLG